MESQIRECVREVTLVPEMADKLKLQDSLFASGVLDSLGLIRLISLLERKFHIAIPVEDVSVEQFSTFNGLIQYIKQAKKESVEDEK
jgi:acyl carrier protein